MPSSLSNPCFALRSAIAIARDALIDGDLEATRSIAHELAEHDYGDAFPPSWKHWVGDMQRCGSG